MKTTLAAFATLAMVTMASAETVLTLDANDLKINNGTYTDSNNVIQTSGYGNFSMTLVLNTQKFLDAVKANPFSITHIITADGSGADIGLSIKSHSTYGTGLYGTWNTADTLYAFWTDTSGTTGAKTSHLTEYLSEHASTTYTDIAITFEIGGTSSSGGATTYLTLVDSTGTATTLYGINGGLKGNSFGNVNALTYNTDMVKHLVVDNTMLSADNAHAANVAAIAAAVPEPATATFSLLALAGLAARRRRK